MTARICLILLTLVCPLLLVLSTVAGAAAMWLMAPLVCALPMLLIGIASTTHRPPWVGLVAVWALLSGSWLVLLWLSGSLDLSHPTSGQAALVVGVMLLGLGLLPLVAVGWLFAAWFPSETPVDEASGPRTGGSLS